MATAMIYDTLKLAEQLEHEAGFDGPRARAMARILAENTGGNLATREDVRENIERLRAATREDVRENIERLRAATREDIETLRTTTREDIETLRSELGKLASKEELRAEVHDLRAGLQDVRGDIRVLYWMAGTTLAGVTGILGIAITIALHLMHLE